MITDAATILAHAAEAGTGKKSRFDTPQAITVTAASADSLDQGAAIDIGIDGAVKPFVRVVDAFEALTSLKIELQVADDAAGTNAVTVSERTVVKAGLTKDTFIPLPPPRAGTAKRWIRFLFTVTGSDENKGTLLAGLGGSESALPANAKVTA